MDLARLFVVGLNHRTAPVAVREKYSVPCDRIGLVLSRLKDLPGLEECVVVSTCNRTELYGRRTEGAPGPVWFFQRMAGACGAGDDAAPPSDELLYWHQDVEAVHHLFRVGSSLDSLVIGETEITGQLKEAYRQAHAAGTTGRMLNRLFQKAFSVAKAVRTQSGIGRCPTSVGSVSVDLATRILGDNPRRQTILIIGAGKIGETALRHLDKNGERQVLVCNRSPERAAALAGEFQGEAVRWEELPQALCRADIVIGSTSAPHYVVTCAQAEAAMARRRGRPLFLIDLAVPRDIDPAARDLDGVYLWNIDELQEIADQNHALRLQEAVAAEEQVLAAVRRFAGRFAGPEGRDQPLPEREAVRSAHANPVFGGV